MTVLVGVLARDGAVIAADRQLSDGTVGIPTAKIAEIGGCALVASSGPIALVQKIRTVFERLREDIISRRYDDALPKIESSFRSMLLPAIEFAEAAKQAAPGAEDNVFSSSLVCLPFLDGMRLCRIDWDGAVYALTEDIPYAAVGSGKTNADPFLRFIWDVFWPERGFLPSLQEAILAAYWTVHLNIECQSDGVGMGFDVWSLRKSNDGSYHVEELSDALDPHREFIEELKSAMRDRRDRTFGSDGVSTNPPPVLGRRP